jgi:hypothetical protein
MYMENACRNVVENNVICIYGCPCGATLYYGSKLPAGGHNCILVSSPLKWQWLQLRRL